MPPIKVQKRVKYKPLTIKKLKKEKNHLLAACNVNNQFHQKELLSNLGKSKFELLCTCMHDFIKDKGVMSNYLKDEEITKLSETLKPWKRNLKKFISPSISYDSKRKLLGKKQRGGSVILAAVISTLLPMAINAIHHWITGK